MGNSEKRLGCIKNLHKNHWNRIYNLQKSSNSLGVKVTICPFYIEAFSSNVESSLPWSFVNGLIVLQRIFSRGRIHIPYTKDRYLSADIIGLKKGEILCCKQIAVFFYAKHITP